MIQTPPHYLHHIFMERFLQHQQTQKYTNTVIQLTLLIHLPLKMFLQIRVSMQKRSCPANSDAIQTDTDQGGVEAFVKLLAHSTEVTGWLALRSTVRVNLGHTLQEGNRVKFSMLQRNNTSTYVQQFKRNRQIVLADLSVNVHLISANKLFLKESRCTRSFKLFLQKSHIKT